MKFRTWLNIITIFLLAVVVYFGWNQIVQAFGLLGGVNPWIFLLIIPLQFLSYFATGETMTSYLKKKGDLVTTSRLKMTRLALESNFVNHIVPVPGVASFAYSSWVLNHYKVSANRSTMSQIIRFVLIFVSFVAVLIISVVALAFDNKMNRLVLVLSSMVVTATICLLFFMLFVMGNRERIVRMSGWLTKTTNKIVEFFTRGKKKQILKLEVVEKYFNDIHQDYIEIRNDKKILVKPFLWATLANVLDAMLVFVVFLSLGTLVNPASLFIAFGLSSIVSFFAATPGGTGVYEAIMIGFLTSAAGVPASVAIAGTLLARATLLTITISLGYVLYQLTVNKYGKITKPTNI